MALAASNNFLDRFLRKRYLLHIIFWIVVLFYFIIGYGKPGKYGLEFYRSLAFLPNHIWLVYAFLYFLIPRFLLKNRIIPFFVLAIVFVGFNMYFSYLINFKFLASHAIQKSTWWSLGSSLLGALTVLGIAVSIKLLRYWYQQKHENSLIVQEKISLELQSLKAQVHPHFLFNTLNNLYSLILENSKNASSVILELSDLLRYMLYECNAELVPLQKEIEIMDHYIELEKLRYGDRIEISKKYTGMINGKKIPPLLFLPLIENTFKHGTSHQLDQCWISIYINVTEDVLQFTLINSKLIDKNKDSYSGGIGLQNLEKRLRLLYGNNFNLKILSGEENFTVSLSIMLKDIKQTI